MLKIRLMRLGKRNSPFYRVVVSEKANKLSGKYVAKLGEWLPSKNTQKIDLKLYQEWINKGALPSTAVKNLVKSKTK